jgi:hypothetical protein
MAAQCWKSPSCLTARVHRLRKESLFCFWRERRALALRKASDTRGYEGPGPLFSWVPIIIFQQPLQPCRKCFVRNAALAAEVRFFREGDPDRPSNQRTPERFVARRESIFVAQRRDFSRTRGILAGTCDLKQKRTQDRRLNRYPSFFRVIVMSPERSPRRRQPPFSFLGFNDSLSSKSSRDGSRVLAFS